MPRLAKNIFRDAIMEYTKDQGIRAPPFDVPYRYVEVKFRLEGYGKKAAFDWIVELCELYGYDFDNAYIKIRS